MNKFKMCDRVAVYDQGIKYKCSVFAVLDNMIMIQLPSLAFVTVHYKQCRKLKPKAKIRQFKGEWRHVPAPQGSAQQMAFIPDEPYFYLADLAGTTGILREVKT